MRQSTFRSWLGVIGCVLAMSTAAAAANTTIATAWQAVLGEKRSQELAPDEVGYYGIELQPWRSFAAFCWEPALEDPGTAPGACFVSPVNGYNSFVEIRNQS